MLRAARRSALQQVNSEGRSGSASNNPGECETPGELGIMPAGLYSPDREVGLWPVSYDEA